MRRIMVYQCPPVCPSVRFCTISQKCCHQFLWNFGELFLSVDAISLLVFFKCWLFCFSPGKQPSTRESKKPTITCGKPVNSTQYDHLRGIANRNEHAHIPEPEVALIFKKKGSKSSEVDMNSLEDKLKKTLKEVLTNIYTFVRPRQKYLFKVTFDEKIVYM